MIFFSVACYHYLEAPILSSSWLNPKSASGSGRQGGRGFSASWPKLQFLGLGALASSALVVVPLALTAAGPVDASLTPPVVPTSISEKKPQGPETNQTKLTAQIESAVGATEWPALVPSVDSIAVEGKPVEDESGCGRTDFSKANSCIFGEGKTKTVVVLGDSTGITLLPTVREALGSEYTVRGMTMAACIVLDVASDRPADVQAGCAQHRADSIAEINRTKPDLVFVSNSTGPLDPTNSGSKIKVAPEDWKSATEALIKQIQLSGAKPVIVSSAPLGPKFPKCATRTSSPQGCITVLSDGYQQAATASEEAARNLGAAYMDTRLWFCTEHSICPSFVGTTLVKRDTVHTTRQYAVQLAPVFKEQWERIAAG
jgi:hypothetical protein